MVCSTECELEDWDWPLLNSSPLLSTAWHLLGPLKSFDDILAKLDEKTGPALAHVVSIQSNTTNIWDLALQAVGENQDVVCELYLNIHIPTWAKAHINCVRYHLFIQIPGSDQSSCCPWRWRGWRRLLQAQLPVFWFSLYLSGWLCILSFAFCPLSVLSGGATVCLLFSSKLKTVWELSSRNSRGYKYLVRARRLPRELKMGLSWGLRSVCS